MTENRRSGIQKKYLTYTIGLLLLALLLSSVGVWLCMRKNFTETIVDKYAFMDEKMGMSLDMLYEKSDKVMAECILNEGVQNSLRSAELTDVEKNALSKYFAYLDLDSVLEYCYVDNKQNVYTRSYSKIAYEDFEESGFDKLLGEEYSRTKWIWNQDRLFGVDEEALFIGRYVRNMDYDHEPGMLFLKMNESFLEDVIGTDAALADEVAVGIMTEDGEICRTWYPENFSMNDNDLNRIRELSQADESGVLISSSRTAGGVLSMYRQEQSGLSVFTLVPNHVLNRGLMQILMVMATVYLIVIFLAVNLSIYFSRRLTRPIQQISKTMTSFDGNDFSHTIELHTNTELDEIGHSYNEMLGNIETLVQEITNQQKELRVSEMNMLISQINPHFLYNTLDTIYMLARINKEEKTMKMIQALSKYLRLCLSKGSDVVTLADELENVKSYMEIQQIRNQNLFAYEIDCRVNAENCHVIKLILQPLVENAIKYGFCDLYEGGMIQIQVKCEDGSLMLSVYNNGSPIEQEMADKINSLNDMAVVDMKEVFPDKKHGYGVTNIFTRLRLKYGEAIRFTYERRTDGTLCVIRLPGEGKTDEEK